MEGAEELTLDKYFADGFSGGVTTVVMDRKEWDLIEFYKQVKEKIEVRVITIDEESHTLSFHGVER